MDQGFPAKIMQTLMEIRIRIVKQTNAGEPEHIKQMIYIMNLDIICIIKI